MGSRQLLLVGNPNVGKSVLFNLLTRTYTTVSNYPGTTVSIAKGKGRLHGEEWEILDTPGIHSLIPMSEDERITRDLLLKSGDAIVIQVADAKNLERSLPLSLQLQELGIGFLLAINMSDEAEGLGIQINAAALEKQLGVPVVPTIATRGEGIALLTERLQNIAARPPSFEYGSDLEAAVRTIEENLGTVPFHGLRAIATMLLSGDRSLAPLLAPHLSAPRQQAIQEVVRVATAAYAEPVGFLLGQERSRISKKILKTVQIKPVGARSRLASKLGKWAVHPVFGLGVLALVLEMVYQFVGKFGAGVCVDFIEHRIFGAYLSPGAIWLVGNIFHSPHLNFFRDFLVGPYGQITMGLSYGLAIVFPIVTTFFIAFSLMEDSGYLPRLAVMLNRLFRWMGLNGKAVLPMVLGLGCDTMATMTTRILETRKQRLIVILLLALAVPCSAQLGILLGMFAILPAWAFLVWLGVILGVMFLVGFAANRILPGEASAFLMEIPPLRLPQWKNVAKKTFSRMEWYLKEALPLFLLGTAILFLLDFVHLLTRIQKIAEPLVTGILGLPKEAANAFLIGFLRRDYGATGFFNMYKTGSLSVSQTVVALVVITLFVPCIANVFMILKEQGKKAGLAMICFIFPFAFLIGGILKWLL